MKIKSIKKINGWYDGWLKEKYGTCVAQISTDSKIRLKTAVRDVARFYEGEVSPDIEALSKKFKTPPQGVEDISFITGYKDDEGHWIPGSLEQGHSNTDNALIEYIERYPKHWEAVQKCLGLVRQKSRHACAFVITDRPVGDFIPLTQISGMTATQFTAEDVESVGALKYDFLGLNSLRDISKTVKLVQKKYGLVPDSSDKIEGIHSTRALVNPKTKKVFDIWNPPEYNEVFYKIMEGDNESVFQLCTAGARRWIKFFNGKKDDGSPIISSIYDIAIFTALNRPGPLDILLEHPETGSKHNALVEYSRRVQGLKRSNDIPEIMDEMFPETQGILVFQESLQSLYQKITGCSRTEAEEFRRNVSKKKKSAIEAAYPHFMESAQKNLSQEQSQQLWDMMKTWSAYGFNASHAVSYGLIAYVCAFLKYFYPLEWWCSVLDNADKDDRIKFWKQCGDKILFPNIQTDIRGWHIVGDKIQSPIYIADGLGDKAYQQLVDNAPYQDITDYCQKICKYMIENKTEVKTVKIDDNGKKFLEIKTRFGTSPINVPTTNRLIISGCMDSLFSPNMTDQEKIELFETTLKRVKKENGMKHSKTKFQIPQNPYEKYLEIKKVIPVFTQDLRQFLSEIEPDDDKEFNTDLLLEEIDGTWKMGYDRWDSGKIQYLDIEDGQTLEEYANSNTIPEHGYNVAFIGYVMDTKTITSKNTGNQGFILTLDVGGATLEFSRWKFQDEHTNPAKNINKGDVIVGNANRSNPNFGFSIGQLSTVRSKNVTAD